MQPIPSSRPLLFLSDVHLGGFSEIQNRELEQGLINLIDYCQQNGIKIFVLGDLFDYWMEYPNHVPELGIELRKQFEHYNREFGPTLYITGNHDNWTRSYFESIGFTVEPDYRYLTAADQKFLLLHGDGLLDEERKIIRPAIHRLLRNKTFIKYYQRILPPGMGLWVMRWFSRINRMLAPLKEDIQTLNRWAEQVLTKTDTDYVICGHDHYPRELNFSFGSYLNLGTFYKHQTAVLYNNGSVNLVVWNDTHQKLETFYTADNVHE